ncbi:hypothetical protein BELL_1259g00020 [Botrytis elliptica]|uniref:Uncharacterized protein n=1 Tax=Botrytis elliptica TaxID=278938 RepID=A0A4Z1ICW0_9HELO|nr:hypothetical protein BELL_1259g00020 [Botrytis elliptica]
MDINQVEASRSGTDPPLTTKFESQNDAGRRKFQARVKEYAEALEKIDPKTSLKSWMSLKVANDEVIIKSLQNPVVKLEYYKLSSLISSLGLDNAFDYTGTHKNYLERAVEAFLPKKSSHLSGGACVDVKSCYAAINSYNSKMRNHLGFAVLVHFLTCDDFLQVKIHEFSNRNQRSIFFRNMLIKFPNVMVLLADSVGMILDTNFVYATSVYTTAARLGKDVPGSLPTHAEEDRIKYTMKRFHMARGVKLLETIFRARLNVGIEEPFPRKEKYKAWELQAINSWSLDEDINKLQGLFSLGDMPAKESYDKIHRSMIKAQLNQLGEAHDEVEDDDLFGDDEVADDEIYSI